MMQADSPARFDRVTNTPTQKMDDELVKCPPPPRHLPAFSCLVPACQSDKSCSDKGLKCCYNGCQYTCMIPVEPPSCEFPLCFLIRMSVRACVRACARAPARPPARPSVRAFVHPSVRPSVRSCVRPCVRASRASVRPFSFSVI